MSATLDHTVAIELVVTSFPIKTVWHGMYIVGSEALPCCQLHALAVSSLQV